MEFTRWLEELVSKTWFGPTPDYQELRFLSPRGKSPKVVMVAGASLVDHSLGSLHGPVRDQEYTSRLPCNVIQILLHEDNQHRYSSSGTLQRCSCKLICSQSLFLLLGKVKSVVSVFLGVGLYSNPALKNASRTLTSAWAIKLNRFLVSRNALHIKH
jgi:hypothetical protein